MPGYLTIAGIVLLIIIVGLIALYFFSPTFRFWFFDIWCDLPVIGTIARRWSRMSHPTTNEANQRLDELFHAYHLHIREPRAEKDYQRMRTYLFLAGDSESRPTPMLYMFVLLVLMVAEAFTFSFLLGVSISPDITENQANIVAVVLALLMAVLFAGFAHPAGHAIKRTKELRSAWNDAIDEDELPVKGEKSHLDLTECISLDEDQEKDKPRKVNCDSQRQLNRMRISSKDRGSYFLPTLFIIVVIVTGVLQFQLRSASTVISEALALPGAEQLGANTPVWANGFFVLLFFLTQGLALYLGYRFGFLGKESARAHRLIGGRDSYDDYLTEYDDRVRRADESLKSLLAKFDRRYPKTTPDQAKYRVRLARLGQPQVGASTGSPPPPPPPPPPPAKGNVASFPPKRQGGEP